MRILVTGGTGFIGRALVKALVQAGHSVAVLTRDPERARQVIAAPCEPFAWNAVKDPVPAAALKGCDAVIHLAGEGIADERWSKERRQALADSRRLGTRHLMESILGAEEKPKVLIAASAVGFYGDRSEDRLTEDSEGGVGFLSQLCADWEREVRQHRIRGMRTVCLRLGAVLGDGGMLERLIPVFRSGAGGPVGSGRQWMSWIHLTDLIELFLFALESKNASGVLNGVSPQAVTNAHFSAELAKTLKVPHTFRAPSFALRVGLGEMSSLLLSSQRVIPEAVLILGFQYRFPTLEQALADLCGTQGEKNCDVWVEEQWVPVSPEQIFPFFADPRNLEKITPPFLKFEVLQVSTPVVQVGTLIDYRLKLRGMPLRWRSSIEQWEPSHCFVDVQLKGPYSLWHHTHRFEALADGTLITDRVLYRVPLGRLGQLVGSGRVRREVEEIFTFRRKAIHKLFAPGK